MHFTGCICNFKKKAKSIWPPWLWNWCDAVYLSSMNSPNHSQCYLLVSEPQVLHDKDFMQASYMWFYAINLYLCKFAYCKLYFQQNVIHAMTKNPLSCWYFWDKQCHVICKHVFFNLLNFLTYNIILYCTIVRRPTYFIHW